MNQYMILQTKTIEITTKFLKKCLIPTNNLINSIIEAETSYINTNHHDFISLQMLSDINNPVSSVDSPSSSSSSRSPPPPYSSSSSSYSSSSSSSSHKQEKSFFGRLFGSDDSSQHSVPPPKQQQSSTRRAPRKDIDDTLVSIFYFLFFLFLSFNTFTRTNLHSSSK